MGEKRPIWFNGLIVGEYDVDGYIKRLEKALDEIRDQRNRYKAKAVVLRGAIERALPTLRSYHISVAHESVVHALEDALSATGEVK